MLGIKQIQNLPSSKTTREVIMFRCPVKSGMTNFKLPLQNLVKVVSLWVRDAESLYSFVVSLCYVVSDVLVVVLCSTAVDVNYAWWDLTSVRVLEVCEVEW